jgi:protein-disulfide isomerase
MGKRYEMRNERRRTRNRNRVITLSIIGVGVLIIIGIILAPNFQSAGSIVMPTPVARPQPQGMSMGNPDAPVKVVEYADFQCPACLQATESILPGIISNYIATGQVYFTIKPFAFLDDNGPGRESKAAAEAAYCANDQGKFWDYYDILFANQTGENIGDFTDVRLIAFANKLGLNNADFKSCFTSGKYKQQVLDDRDQGSKIGVTGTPSFDVNGTIVYANDLEPTIQKSLGGN